MIQDPIEIMSHRIERLCDSYKEGVCMGCGKQVDYELVCPSPLGDGPLLCADCFPEGHIE